VRGDSHYGRDEVMEWCEENQGIEPIAKLQRCDEFSAGMRGS
jgi:hypothetical protein